MCAGARKRGIGGVGKRGGRERLLVTVLIKGSTWSGWSWAGRGELEVVGEEGVLERFKQKPHFRFPETSQGRGMRVSESEGGACDSGPHGMGGCS
jgi:hypothetical protein